MRAFTLLLNYWFETHAVSWAGGWISGIICLAEAMCSIYQNIKYYKGSIRGDKKLFTIIQIYSQGSLLFQILHTNDELFIRSFCRTLLVFLLFVVGDDLIKLFLQLLTADVFQPISLTGPTPTPLLGPPKRRVVPVTFRLSQLSAKAVVRTCTVRARTG